jgi:hypothetical protein
MSELWRTTLIYWAGIVLGFISGAGFGWSLKSFIMKEKEVPHVR